MSNVTNLDIRRGVPEPEHAEVIRLRAECRSYARGNSKLHADVQRLQNEVAKLKAAAA